MSIYLYIQNIPHAILFKIHQFHRTKTRDVFMVLPHQSENYQIFHQDLSIDILFMM